MIFNRHSYLEGQHAFLGASKCSWLNYDEARLTNAYTKHLATMKGTQLHDFASQAIKLGIRLPRTKETLNMFVNDAIGYKMDSEQPLFYSVNCFGTTDAISFRNGLLRIHDLKTGVTPASFHQLEVYAAFFCLEYAAKPGVTPMELRIYQNDAVLVYKPSGERITEVMSKIVAFDKIIERLKKEV